MRRTRRCAGWLGALLLLLLALVAAREAAAQTPSPLANWQYSSGIALAPAAGHPLPEWLVVVGGSADLSPQYEGSQRYIVRPGPAILVRYKDRFYFSTGEGIGVDALRGKNYRAGVGISYDLGRDQDLNLRLRGLGDIDPAPELRLYGEYVIFPFVLHADLRRGLGGHDGYIGDVGFYVPVAGSEKFFVFVGPSFTWADDRYMSSYFGITPAQATRSQFAPFTASGGAKSARMGLTAEYNMTEHWFAEADLAYERLLGDAADSPITEDPSQFALALTVGYRF
jgi:outer membrane scaffolding protein for murein synthesis (MipA/OmpV family)